MTFSPLLYKHISSQNILEIRSNIKNLIGFKFGSKCIKNNNTAASRIVLYYIADSLKNIKVGENQLFLSRPLTFFPAAKALIELRNDKVPALSANKSYDIWSNLRGTSSFARPEDILSNLATIQLLSSKLAPLHCGCVDMKGKGILLIAPSDTGKTFTTYSLVNDFGFSFVSEDIAITDGSSIYGCPYTATGIPKCKNGKEFLGNRFKNLFFPSKSEKRKLADYIPQNKIVPQTKISYIIFLKRGPRNISAISKSEAAKYLIRSNMTEFKYITDRDLLTLWNQFDYPDLMQLNKTEKMLLEELVNNANELITVSSPQPEGFVEQIAQRIIN